MADRADERGLPAPAQPHQSPGERAAGGLSGAVPGFRRGHPAESANWRARSPTRCARTRTW
ncbi:hypothetical protein ACPA9J_16095 [Pseudomonas aeruginosa]